MLNIRTVLCLMVFSICLSIGCNDRPNHEVAKKRLISDSSLIEQKLLQLLVKKADLSVNARKQILDSLSDRIALADYRVYNLHLYLSGVLLENSGNSDSAVQVFNSMLNEVKVDSLKDADLIILKSIGYIGAESNTWIDGKLITQLQNTIKFAERINYKYIYEVYNTAAGTYYKYGDTIRPVHYLRLGFDKYPLPKTPSFKAYYYNRMGTCLIAASRWKEANSYLDSGYQVAIAMKDTILMASTYEKKRSIYAASGNRPKEIFYQNQAFAIKRKAGLLTETDWSNQALNFQQQGKYDDAIQYYHQALALAKDRNNSYIIQTSYAGLHANYMLLKNFDLASRYHDSSYEALVSIVEKREADKVADITLKYEQEKKDEKISQLNKQTSLQGQILSQQKAIIFILAAFILTVITVSIILFRERKLRMENERLEASWNKVSLELRLLRSQMEPHLLFNMLADLQGLIRTGEKERAGNFLSKFARYIQLNLQNSRTEWVLLAAEIESLESYLALQQMRYENSFDFTISVYEGHEDDNILIPPMVLQPFVENAILHGLNEISYKGNIDVDIQKKQEVLRCIIDDNGCGFVNRKAKKKNSFSTSITQERLQVLSKQTGQPASLFIIDKAKENLQGVRIELTFPYKLSDV